MLFARAGAVLIACLLSCCSSAPLFAIDSPPDDGKLKTLYRTLRLATKIRMADYLQERGPLFISPTKDLPVD